jgi:membrane protease YdiL (CAAX protease family)
MTTVRRALEAPAWLRVTWLLLALCVAALARAALNGHSPFNAFGAGTLFGAVLLAVAWAGGWHIQRPTLPALLLGVAGGLVLVVLPRLAHPGFSLPIGMRPEPFAAWALVTGLVVVAEEALLRGALLDAVRDAAGLPAAVLLTSAAFALMHVPLYGWSVVPIDLAAGVWLAGLRLAGGGIAAPAVAHFLADLAGWWT